jgi:hypothetical protein
MIKVERADEEVVRKRQRQEDDGDIVVGPRKDEVEKKIDVVEFPNNPSNVKDFGWCKHGEDQVREGNRGGKKKPDEPTFLKEYYICSKKKAGGTCNAKKRVHHLPGSDITECVGLHDHLPPEKVKPDPDVQRKIEDYSKVGAKATVIQAS